MDRIIDIIKFIGKRGLSFRGKKFEASYLLEDPKLDKGNFLELILLLSKYDIVLKEHLTLVISASKTTHEKFVNNSYKTMQGRGSLITFISKSTINLATKTISLIYQKAYC